MADIKTMLFSKVFPLLINKVETIEDPFMKRVRQLDKLIDELAKGREVGKITFINF